MEKYRAWDKNKRRMFDVGDIDFENNLIYTKQYGAFGNPTADRFSLKDIVLMQYTGKKDFCDGDIISFQFKYDFIYNKLKRYKGIIEKDAYGFMVKSLNDKSKPFPLRFLNEVIDEVKKIGDKFQNHELLNN